MPPLPVISGAECIAALARIGYRQTRRSIIRAADLTVEQFIELLARRN